jgi:hypothetical protein
MTVSRPGSKPRSERAQEQIGSLTYGVLGSQLAFLERRALYHCRMQPPQGTGLLPALRYYSGW